MFYISSQGHSATGWLSRSLSMHPKVVCWHGTRSIPPYAPQHAAQQLNPEEFVDGLEICEKRTFGEKQFGSCHGFHGAKLKEFIEKKNGKFFGIIRNPLARVVSIFSSYLGNVSSYGIVPTDTQINYEQILVENSELINQEFKKYKYKIEKKNIIKKYLKKFKLLGVSKTIYSFLRKKKKLFKKKQFNIKRKKNFDFATLPNHEKISAIISTYLHAVERTFATDSEICEACDKNQILKMEDFTSSKEYFKNIFNQITGFEASDNYLKKVFDKKDHINVHSKKKIDIYLQFKKWPECFKVDFLYRYKNCAAKKIYEDFNYGLD